MARYANGPNSRAKVYDLSASVNPIHTPTAGEEASSATHGIIIHGNQRFQTEVIKHLDTINTLPSGKRLIEKLEHKKVDIIPPSYNNVRRVESKEGEKIFLSDNSCSGKSIIFDPENDISGANVKDVANEPWRERNPAIALYHEMLHTYFHYHQQNIFDLAEKNVYRDWRCHHA
ncbi:M91 family zinc metallopeptidase [Sodalis praecaptivus]|uniref:M91 family zinc metallopeptidase n=1 Tax=Sodalis praecaptivus TaxID=1239307 RepID=UPI00280BDC77|nr:M91 family zinc metallopeptidase [Sodalis praecaptivus]